MDDGAPTLDHARDHTSPAGDLRRGRGYSLMYTTTSLLWCKTWKKDTACSKTQLRRSALDQLSLTRTHLYYYQVYLSGNLRSNARGALAPPRVGEVLVAGGCI